MRNNRKPVVIGFTRKTNVQSHYHCQIHQGVRMIQMDEDDDLYRCLECGTSYRPSELKSDTKIQSRFAVNNGGPKIVSGKGRGDKQKKHYDSTGNLLNKSDPDIMNDIAQGHTIVHYSTTETVYDDFKDRKTKTGKDVYGVIR